MSEKSGENTGSYIYEMNYGTLVKYNDNQLNERVKIAEC